MKKNFFIAMAAFAILLGSVSCSKNQVEPQKTGNETEENATLTIALDGGIGTTTRAASVDTVSSGKEDVLKDVQIFIMNDSAFEKYVHVSNWDSLVNASGNLKISVKDGYKEILVLCNGPDLSSKNSRSGVKNQIMELSAHNDPNSGFVMYGEGECELSASQNQTCKIQVSRFVSKIYIAQIKNNLPPQFGNITLNYAFLANLPSKVSIGGTIQSTDWYNMHGRFTESPLVSQHIIDGATYTADVPDLTFKSYSNATVAQGDSLTTKKTFYCLANSYSTAINTFNATFQPCCTKAVIVATINSKKYYYSVNMGRLDRNHVYAIYLTVSGLGSDDPSIAVTKGSIESAISVMAWEKTTAIEEDI